MRDYYDILGVRKNASEKDIKSAYRKLARKYHPDHNPDDKSAEDRFKEITEAHEVLSDPKQRALYDQVGHQAWKAGAKQGQPPGAGAGGWGVPGGGFDGIRFSNSGNMGDLDLEDLLGGMFGGRGGRRRRRPSGPVKGDDSLARLAIPMQDAVQGGERRINLTTGAGRQESITVTIPVGIREGQKIRLTGKGGPGFQGGPPGDLLIEISFESDKRFRREGDQLTTEVKIPFSVAALGGKVSVSTLEGSVELTIPAGTQGGQRMRLVGKGLPSRGKGRGDLFAQIRISIPSELDDRGKELVEELKRYE